MCSFNLLLSYCLLTLYPTRAESRIQALHCFFPPPTLCARPVAIVKGSSSLQQKSLLVQLSKPYSFSGVHENPQHICAWKPLLYMPALSYTFQTRRQSAIDICGSHWPLYAQQMLQETKARGDILNSL